MGGGVRHLKDISQNPEDDVTPTSREVERPSIRSERMILPLRLFEVAMINDGMKRTRSVLELENETDAVV